MSKQTKKEGVLTYTASKDNLKVVANRGDSSVLFGMNFEGNKKPKANFAGFAIHCTPPEGKPFYLPNRLNFTQELTKESKPSERLWTPSDKAPFQRFQWLHVPSNVEPGKYTYEVSAMYWDGAKKKLVPGETTAVAFDMLPENYSNFDIGFTRGYLSSQAYATRFKNAPIRPDGEKTIDYSTKKFLKQYEWLGFRARKMLFDFLDECIKDKSIEVHMFAYDLDEPDFIRGLAKLGTRLKAFLDNASLHTKKGAAEILAKEALEESAGEENIRVGHFGRFAHNKVLIQVKNGKAVKVLAGSMNFSVRGLYVQANNVFLFNDPEVAGLYEQAFQAAFANPSKAAFAKSVIASKWFDIQVAECPDCAIAFSPHKEESISLQKVTDAIAETRESVLFAIMQLGGSGSVLESLQELDNNKIYAWGVTQTNSGLNLKHPNQKGVIGIPFSFLKEKVPEPFRAEWSGGLGQVVHHKFIVLDFNGKNPVLFTGSSNLAGGGEVNNNDNLIAIYDRGIATAYGVEAFRLLDHYRFRASMKQATKTKPLTLQPQDTKNRKWWEPFYDKTNPKYRERKLFSK